MTHAEHNLQRLEDEREANVIWHRPWDDTVYIRNPFSGEAIPVSKNAIPKSLLAKIEQGYTQPAGLRTRGEPAEAK